MESLARGGALFALYAALFRDQAEICRQFWEHDASTVTLSALLNYARRRFPAHITPLLLLLTSLAGDRDTVRSFVKRIMFCFIFLFLLFSQRLFMLLMVICRIKPLFSLRYELNMLILSKNYKFELIYIYIFKLNIF